MNFPRISQGFRKVVPDRWEFSNDCFRQGERGLLRDIQRRKITSPPTAANAVTVAAMGISVSPSNSGDEQVISSNSSPIGGSSNNTIHRTTSCTTTPEILEENEKLRKENSRLCHEVGQLKGLYSNILALMTNYASTQLESSSSIPEGKPLLEANKLVPCDHENVVVEREDPKLFGVSIGFKRCRKEEGDEEEAGKEEAHQNQNQTQSNSQEPDDMKSEPLDGNQSDDQEPPWLELGK